MIKKRQLTLRMYAIILITTCDKCKSSNTVARQRSSRGWQHGPRCECGAQTGPMQWMFLGYVRADGQFDALEKYEAMRKKRNKKED